MTFDTIFFFLTSIGTISLIFFQEKKLESTNDKELAKFTTSEIVTSLLILILLGEISISYTKDL